MDNRNVGFVTGLGQIFQPVSDLDRSLPFYRDVLGLTFLFDVPGQHMAFFDLGGTRLYLGQPEEGPFVSGGHVLYLKVDSVREAHKELVGHDVSFVGEPHVVHRTEAYELWMAFFTDPDGNSLALMSEEGPAST